MSDNKKSFDANNCIDIERLCRLCRISLSEDEREQSARELKKMADYTYPRLCREDSALPFSYCVAGAKARDDEASLPDVEECKKILALSPSNKEGYISVPKIIKGETK